MPLGGEDVGRAYVKILADGTGLDEDIANQFSEVDAEKHGKKAGQDYNKGVRKGIEGDKAKTQKGINELFKADSDRIKDLTKEMESTYYKNLEKRVRARTANNEGLGDRIMRDINKGFLKGGGYAQWGKNFEKLFAQLPALEEKALADMAREQQKFNDEIIKSNKQREDAVIAAGKRRGDAYAKMLDDAYRLNERYDTERLRSINTQQRQIEQLAKAEEQAYKERDHRFNTSADNAVKSFERIRRGQALTGKSVRESIDDTIREIKRLSAELDRVPDIGGGEDHDSIRRTLRAMENGLVSISPRLRRFNTSLDTTAERVGASFGRGSRNDFVNFFGAGIEKVTRLAFSLPKVGENLLGVFKQVRSGTGVFEALGKQFGTAAEGGSSLFSSLAAGAVAIPIVVVVVGTLVSVVSLLLGVLVALASSISFALVGALGVLVGALAPVAAAFAVITAGILGMSDAQKKALGQAIKPFTKEMKALASVAASHLFADAPEQASRLAGIFSGLRPLVSGVADAVREVGNGFLDALEGPGFKRFKDEMTKFLPDAVGQLGRAFGNVIGGIGGLFVALIPATQRFLGWLEKVTANFAKFTNSAEGQNKIKKFMDDALESAKSVGHFLGELGGLITDLLFNSEGKKTGDSLFDSMADGIKRFRDYIADGGLEKWFKDAKKFGEDLGDTIVDIGKVLDKLDSPEFRKFASLLISTFGTAAGIIEDIVTPVNDLVTALDDLFHLDFAGFGENIARAFGGLGKVFLNTLSLGHSDEIIGFVTGIASDIGNAFADIDFTGIGNTIVTGIGNGISNAAGAIAGAVSSFFSSLGSLASSIASTIWNLPGVQMVAGLVAGIASSIGNLGGAILALGASILGLIGRGFAQAGKEFGSTVVAVVGPALSRINSVVGPVASYVSSKFSSAFGTAKSKAGDFGNYIGGKFSSLLGSGRSAASSLGSYLSGKASSAFSGARSNASSLGSYVAGKFSSAFGSASDAIGGVKSILSGLKSLLDSAASGARALARDISKIKPPSLGGLGVIKGLFSASGSVMGGGGMFTNNPTVKRMAAGGFANFAQNYQIGEAGREAIVPLDRPLGQVDPAVRLLSAFAQGKLGEINNSRTRTVDASGWIIQSPNDAETVARETLDALVAKIG